MTRSTLRKSSPCRGRCLGIEVINLSPEICYARYFVENSLLKTDYNIMEFMCFRMVLVTVPKAILIAWISFKIPLFFSFYLFISIFFFVLLWLKRRSLWKYGFISFFFSSLLLLPFYLIPDLVSPLKLLNAVDAFLDLLFICSI